MTDFPRGWTQSGQAIGGTAAFTLAAIAGVAHILDSFAAKLINQTAAAANRQVTLTSSDGVFAGIVLASLFTPPPAAGGVELDSASGSELGLVAGPGASMTITFSGGPVASITELLTIQGHDI